MFLSIENYYSQTSYFFPSINHYFVKRIHFVGIGGAGMCGIAKILLYQGYYITGSDIVKNDKIRYLSTLGVKIFFGHYHVNINNVDIVVISSAIGLENPEVQAAKQINIPIIKRSQVLFELMRYKYSIAIAGTHGKTTTTAMLTHIYFESKLDPTFINGEIMLKSHRVQAHLGCSHYLIAESDESDKSFLKLYPTVAVITNIDADHMCAYDHNFLNLEIAFNKFLNNLPVYGYAVVCIDDPRVRKILCNINKSIITYGFNEDANLRILDYVQCVEKSSFTVLTKNNRKLKITLHIPGRHNALNAVAAMAVSMQEGIRDDNIVKAICSFRGIKRRFEILGFYSLITLNGQMGKIMLIDDYGHHPAELHATIETARIGWPDNRLIMIFQPHRFTRTRELYNNFIHVLSSVDVLLILDIYSAGEKSIIGVNSQSLCNSIFKYGKIQPIFISNKYILLEILLKLLRDRDLILIQGAGTIGEVVRSFFKKDTH